LTTERSSIISPTGVNSLPSAVMASARLVASAVSASLSGVPGIDERGAGQVQAHDLHQHLVRVGGAVERARARPVIGFGFRLQQFRPPDLAFGIELADSHLLVVGKPAGHRPGGNEHRRQMAEAQGRDQQSRHDLVADAQVDRSIEHVVRQSDGRRHGDHVAGEQRQLHPRLALGDAVAHGRHAARHLRHAAGLARSLADQFGVGLERLVRRQHVIVGGDDAEIGHHVFGKVGLVVRPAGGKSVRKVAA
jgi:hypothetical protein